MSDLLIRDIPSIKNTLNLIRGINAIRSLMPFLKPIFRVLKIDVSKINEYFFEVNDLSQLVESLAIIPDRFNELFAVRGWIIYEDFDLEIAKEAISIAETLGTEEAEIYLLNYYTPEKIRWHLMKMYSVQAFHPRMLLAEKAAIDYEEERYHACVPVVLALLDGMVNEIHKKRRGFFSDEAELKAWDSISANQSGLSKLADIFKTGRYKTTSEAISIPYRNGIIHGMDLGYDNKTVAAKTWAGLFATRDWAVKAEKGLLNEPPPTAKKSWGDRLQEFLKVENDKRLLDEWSPRLIIVGLNCPTSNEPSEFNEGTPERSLVEFLYNLRTKNYGRAASFLMQFTKQSPNKDAGLVREIYSNSKINNFEILSVEDIAAAVTEIKIKIFYEGNDDSINEITFRMVNEDENGNPTIRDKPNSRWCVANWGHAAR